MTSLLNFFCTVQLRPLSIICIYKKDNLPYFLLKKEILRIFFSLFVFVCQFDAFALNTKTCVSDSVICFKCKTKTFVCKRASDGKARIGELMEKSSSLSRRRGADPPEPSPPTCSQPPQTHVGVVNSSAIQSEVLRR